MIGLGQVGLKKNNIKLVPIKYNASKRNKRRFHEINSVFTKLIPLLRNEIHCHVIKLRNKIRSHGIKFCSHEMKILSMFTGQRTCKLVEFTESIKSLVQIRSRFLHYLLINRILDFFEKG